MKVWLKSISLLSVIAQKAKDTFVSKSKGLTTLFGSWEHPWKLGAYILWLIWANICICLKETTRESKAFSIQIQIELVAKY